MNEKEIGILERIEQKLSGTYAEPLKVSDKYVIIRASSAGVFAGELVSRNGSEVKLNDCRRLWYWSGAASLSQLAIDGTSKPKDCKFSMPVNGHEVLGVIEVLPATEKAQKSIKEVAVWKA